MTTTDSPELTIFDVGHGNCALLRDEGVVYVIDVPTRSKELWEALNEQEIKKIDAVLVSHGDEDHVGGVSGLITNEDLVVKRLYVNPDVRKTLAWKAVRIAIRDRESRDPGFKAHTEFTTTSTAELQLPRVQVRVLAPRPHLAAGGASGETIEGKRLSANSMSAVVHFSVGDGRGVLFTGDVDGVGLAEMLSGDVDLGAEVLIFPHHGGSPGGAPPRKFAAGLTTAVNPDVIIFSLGGGGEMPKPEIVAGIRESCPDAHLACTELSGHCGECDPPGADGHLSGRPGRAKNEQGYSSCAGTLDFTFLSDRLECAQLPGHAEWIAANLPQRLCARYPATATAS